jgi:hypothetical protein
LVSPVSSAARAAALEDLEECVNRLETKEYDFAEKTINDVLPQVEQQSDRQTIESFKVVGVETDDYIRQTVQKNESIIDLTLLSHQPARL